MKKSGFLGIYFGFESLKCIGKNDLEDVEEALRLLRENRIFAVASVILDLNGDETFEVVRETISWLKERGVLFMQLSLHVLIPGTLDYKKALKDGKIINHSPLAMDGSQPTKKHQASPEVRSGWLRYGYHEVFPKREEKLRWFWLTIKLVRTMGYNPDGYKEVVRIVRHIQRSLRKWNE